MDVVALLKQFGWMAHADESIEDALKQMQRWYGLSETGTLDGPTTRLLKAPRFCMLPDRLETMAIRRDDALSLTWQIVGSLPGISTSDFESVVQGAFDSWRAAGVNIIANKAVLASAVDLQVATTRLDGPQGVLADCELPSSPNRLQHCRVDTSENWIIQLGPLTSLARIDLNRVLRHEFGHFLGLGHSSNQADLMAPFISQTIDRPQPGDVQAALSLGYSPVTPTPTPTPTPVPIPPPTPTPTPNPAEPTTLIILGVNGQETYRAHLTRLPPGG